MHEWRDEAFRQKALDSLSRDEIAAAVRALPDDELIAIAREQVSRLGIYRIRLTKQERLRGKFEDPHVLDVTVREEPLALRAEFVEGTARGRRLLYSQELRPDEMRIREKGLLGLAGAVWLGLDSALAKNDSNHKVTELGFASLVVLLQRDLDVGRASGGHARRDIGFEGTGACWTTEYTAPKGCPGLYAERARLTLDLRLGLPVGIEIHDARGLLERYRYELREKSLRVPDDYFTPKGAKL